MFIIVRMFLTLFQLALQNFRRLSASYVGSSEFIGSNKIIFFGHFIQLPLSLPNPLS